MGLAFLGWVGGLSWKAQPPDYAPHDDGVASVRRVVAHVPADAEVWAGFAAWVERQANQPEANQTRAFEQEGIQWATARRNLLKALIERDPEAALRARIPHHLRKTLPVSVQALLEETINTSGLYRVSTACGFGEAGHEDRTERFARIGNRTWRVFTSGRRLEVAGKDELSLVGITLDDVMALEASPVREVPPDEATARGYSPSQWLAEGAGETRVFARHEDLEAWRAALEADEWAVGPQAKATPDFAAAPASTYTEGLKRLLYIVCDFPNLTGFPLTTATLSNAMNAVTSFYFEASYGKTALVPTFVPGVLRLPKNGEYYTNAFSTLLADAETVARAAGYDVNDYDHYVVLTDENTGTINFSYAGKAWIGSPGCHLVEPNYTLRTAGHELGHNFGLRHANYWRTDSDQPTGRDSLPGGYVGDTTNAEWVEYGHQFSLMSGQAAAYMTPAAHFTPAEKRHLNWISSSDLLVVTTSQLVRLYRFDHRLGTQSPRAIRIARPSSDYTGNEREYWLGYRTAFPTNGWLMNGLQVDWMKSYYGSDGSIQLDLTPYSNDDNTGALYTDDLNDKNDGTLLLGRTASDPAADIHITPVARGGIAPDEWIEVVIHLGPAGSNRPPELDLSASATNANPNGALVFTATARDPDGDELAYAWDFGQSRLIYSNSLNRSTVTNTWSTAGEYLVRCVVSDMKGGRTSTGVVVRIGNPTVYRITGRVLDNGQGVEGVRVYTAHTNMTYTDSAGYYQLANLKAASFTVAAQEYGQALTPAFDNPVSVGPPVSGRNFGRSGAPALIVDDLDGRVEVAEAGGTDTYRIRLGGRPATNVTLLITWDTNQVAVTGHSLVLTPNDWLTGRVFTVSARDNLQAESLLQTSELAHVSSSADPAYDGLLAPDLPVYVIDDDVNQNPGVAFVTPVATSRWVERITLPVQVWSEDTDGVITQVVLSANGISMCTWTQAPFVAELQPFCPGGHTLALQAWDNLGATSTYSTIQLQVLGDLDGDGCADLEDDDDDGDGLGDAFEVRHFGGVTNGQPYLDEDADGFCNLSEQVAATDPTNALSYFHLLVPQPGRPDQVVVQSEVGRLYTLQASGGLNDGNTWSNITGQVDLPGTGAALILSDPSPQPMRIYRLWVSEL